MSEEMQTEAAPVDMSPPSEPVSEPSQSEVSSDPMEREMAATFDKIHQTRAEDGKWSRPPEYRPEAPPSEAQELDAPEQEQQASEIAPPVGLNKAAREHWASLPEPVKQFISERELQSQQKITELGQSAQAARQIGEVFEQFRETAPKLADGRPAPPTQVMQHLLAANDALERNPAEALQYLARHYGVELGGQPADVEQIRQQAYAEAQQQAYAEMQQHFARHQERERYQHTQQITEHVLKFASEKNENWERLEPDILHHIAGLKATQPGMDPRQMLETAYAKALASNPQYDSNKKAAAKKAADEAKRLASLNVRSGGSFFTKATKGDIYAGMAETYDRLHGHSGRY